LADFVDQGLVRKGRRVSIRAWGVSLCVHAVVLSVFAAVKFSQPSSDVVQSAAIVGVSQVKAMEKLPTVRPKPKVVSAGRGIGKASELVQPTVQRRLFEPPRADFQKPIEADCGLVERAEYAPARMEFFGSVGTGRRVCYVVDCSGSMRGLWQRVREELYESIGRLQQDQYFCVIVFTGDSVLESGDGRLARATEQNKKQSYGFIDTLVPAGSTDALAALERAVKIRDEGGIGASVIYFLTDGFDLSPGEYPECRSFAHTVATMLRSFAPKTQINTIGFWPGEQDAKELGMIAKQSGGQFLAVTDNNGAETAQMER